MMVQIKVKYRKNSKEKYFTYITNTNSYECLGLILKTIEITDVDSLQITIDKQCPNCKRTKAECRKHKCVECKRLVVVEGEGSGGGC